jgi:hypothetical protein
VIVSLLAARLPELLMTAKSFVGALAKFAFNRKFIGMIEAPETKPASNCSCFDRQAQLAEHCIDKVSTLLSFSGFLFTNAGRSRNHSEWFHTATNEKTRIVLTAESTDFVGITSLRKFWSRIVKAFTAMLSSNA